MKTQTAPTSSNTLSLILSWAFVGVPLAWGVYNTVKNVVKLFA